MSKYTKVLSLLGKLEEAADKRVAKDVSKAKKDSIDQERVKEALEEKIRQEPFYLEGLEEDEYYDIMDALPKRDRMQYMGDDAGVQMLDENREAVMQLSPKEAAENLQFFEGAEDVTSYLSKLDAKGLKEFKANVSDNDADLYQSALDRLTELGPRKKFSKGSAVVKVWKAFNKEATPKEVEQAKKLVKKRVTTKTYADRPYVTRQTFKLGEGTTSEVLLKKDYPKGGPEFQGKFLQAWRNSLSSFTHNGQKYSVDEATPEAASRTKKAMGGYHSHDDDFKVKYSEGSMALPPELQESQEAPVDTYDNVPEEEKTEVEASQLPDDEMQEEYVEFVLDKSISEEDQEYLSDLLESNPRLSTIFDSVMDTAMEFSGEGEVKGPGTGTSDSIPARLSDGEFVFTRKATDQIGADKLQEIMDNAERAYDGGLMKKAMGGKVEDPRQTEKFNRPMMQGYDTDAEKKINEDMIAANRLSLIHI